MEERVVEKYPAGSVEKPLGIRCRQIFCYIGALGGDVETVYQLSELPFGGI